jgi:hypothetical protein
MTNKLGSISLYKFADSVEQRDGRFYVDVSDKLEYRKPREALTLGTHTRIGSILSRDDTNSKLIKSALRTEALSYIFYGAPAKLSGFNMCSHFTVDCADLCLNTSGNGRYHSNQIYRIARTRLEVFQPRWFWSEFRKDHSKASRRLERTAKQFLAVRPNGTTDRWCQELEQLILDTPETRWYDYTAVPSRLAVADRLPNYDITLSRKETKSNHSWLRAEGYGKRNVAVVVTKSVKAELMIAGKLAGLPIVDFDRHDLRIPEYDGSGVIGLLTPKGKARGVETGFIVSSVAQLKAEIKG